jgi:hypothetical protein
MNSTPLNGGVCSCGHLPTPQVPGSAGTGYGSIFVREDAHGAVYETRCYACCAAYTRERMTSTGRADLYLCERTDGPLSEHSNRDRAEVADWTGLLRFPVTALRRSPRGGGFGSQRTDAYFVGPDGKEWHAVNRGDMQLARCRRLKVQP